MSLAVTRRMRTCLLTLVLLSSLFLSACGSASDAFPKTAATARTEIWKAITTGTAGSATVALMDHGEIVYSEGFGMADRENGIPVDTNTIFNIGSVSKMFVGVAIMMLVGEGKVDLDSPVTTYLPEFTMADERYKDITVRMLLNHTSGLPGSIFWNCFGYEYNESVFVELLEALSKSTLKNRPGELAVYCNDGFTLTEMIVERVSGDSYVDFLAERIFDPLAMSHTGPGVGRIPKSMATAKYYRLDGKSEPLEVLSVLGSGGLSSTAEDLCRFADLFAEGSSLLSEESRIEMLKRQPSELEGKLLGDCFPFGLSWDYADLTPYTESMRLFGKSGGTGHYSSMLYTIPSQGISVAVIGSGPNFGANTIALRILSAYLAEKGLIAQEEKAVEMPIEPQPIPPEIMDYSGYYADSASLLRVALDSDKGELTVYSVDGGNESVMISAVYNNGFFCSGSRRYYFAAVGEDVYLVDHSIDNYVIAQKLTPPANPLNLLVSLDNRIWLRRNVQAFEAAVVVETHVISSSQIPDLPGYVNFSGVKLVKSATHAGMPIKYMRDLTELVLYERDGATWAWLSGAVYMPMELAVSMAAGANAVTIGTEGLNEWLTVGFDAILHFDVPDKGRVIVFDVRGGIYDSLVDSGDVYAPAGSLIELIGMPCDVFGVTAKAVDGSDLTAGEDLYRKAQGLEEQRSFGEAADLYGQALPLLLEEGNMELAALCSEALQRLALFEFTYPLTNGLLKDHLQQAFPVATKEQIEGWIASGKIQHYFWDGQEHYMGDAAANLKYRYMEIMHADDVSNQLYGEVVRGINEIAVEEPEDFWKPYQKPVTYRGIHTVSIPRSELRQEGTYRVWFPVPIITGPQTQVTIESIVPDKWVKQPPSIDEDIGLVYMEIPMEDLTEDLFIQIKFTFTRHEQRFTVDPDNVGEYDKESALYQEYTRSYGNTEITPEIREMAARIVGDETNPYLAARKIYDYIVNNVTYCLMPHGVLWPRTPLTESMYVHTYQEGDCGAQSMYFSALCRSLGIPARATGGFQLMFGAFGTHFWAEFYLPNYGWIPVDTSVAQTAFWSKNLTDEDKQTFIDFFFGNLDSTRCVVQNDTDEPLIPRANGTVLLPLAIQTPAVEYSIPTGEIPALVFQEHWTMELETVGQ